MKNAFNPRARSLVQLLQDAMNHGPEADCAKHILRTIYRIKIHDPTPTTGGIYRRVH